MYTPESKAVIAHLEMLQGIINRMARNSASCKQWCLTLVAAVIFLIARSGNPEYVTIAFIPIVLFYWLDSYYLLLERSFRNHHTEFTTRLHQDKLTPSDLYQFSPPRLKNQYWAYLEALSSISAAPFYLSLLMVSGIVFISVETAC